MTQVEGSKTHGIVCPFLYRLRNKSISDRSRSTQNRPILKTIIVFLKVLDFLIEKLRYSCKTRILDNLFISIYAQGFSAAAFFPDVRPTAIHPAPTFFVHSYRLAHTRSPHSPAAYNLGIGWPKTLTT